MAVIYSKMGGPAGANLLVNPRRLSDGLGVNAVDMRRGSGDLRPIRRPVPVIADTPAISSLLAGDTVIEGGTLVYVLTLAWPTVLPAIYSISWGGGGGTASPDDYVAPPTFTNGVTFTGGNTQIIVPAGVSSFEIRFQTFNDLLVEDAYETLPLTIGGVSAIGNILDDESTTLEVTSWTYPVEVVESLNAGLALGANSRFTTEPMDELNVGLALVSGTLRDGIQFYADEIHQLDVSLSITGGALINVLKTHVQPPEDFIDVSLSITGGTLANGLVSNIMEPEGLDVGLTITSGTLA